MKLYKYRSLRNGFDFVWDILFNERLYCADYSDLNDPLEGYFVVRDSNTPGRFIPGLGTLYPKSYPRQVSDLHSGEFVRSRICSLSRPLDDLVHWSHYGDGHTGVAIEIEFPDKVVPPVHEVKYLESLPEGNDTIIAASSADDILSKKLVQWEHEGEYRVICSDEHYSVAGRISAVYVGCRASEMHVKVLRSCVPIGIPLLKTRVSWYDARVEVSDEISR